MADQGSSTTRLKQCVAPFVFGGIPNHEEGFLITGDFHLKFTEGRTFEDTCRIAAEIGFEGYDLVSPHGWPTLKKYGLTPTMSHLGAAGTPDAGISRADLHDELEKTTRVALQECAEFGAPNIVAMVGPRTELSMEECADNAVAFLNRVKGQAEDLGVTICLENLNSKVDHKGYMFDRHAVGFRDRQEGGLTAGEGPFRRLPRTGAGGGCHPHASREHRLDRAHPLRGQSRSLPDRRGTGSSTTPS